MSSAARKSRQDHLRGPQAARWLRLAAFFVIIAVLAARPLMSETFEHTSVSFIEESGTGPTPAATMLMDALLLAASAIGLSGIRRWTRTSRITAASIGLLMIAVIVSSCLADNKRLALNAGASFLIAITAAAALVRLMSSRWMVSMAVAAMLASGAATAWKCMAWRWFEFDETRLNWQANKQQLIERGIDVESPIIHNFEARLGSGESSGYLSHPNIAGSLLMMWLLPAAGLLIVWLARTFRRRDRQSAEAALILLALCGALTAGLWLTGSNGALVGLAAGGVMMMVIGIAGRRVAARTGLIVAILTGGYLAVIAAATVYGTTKGTLPHSSLAFRWHYWTAAAKSIVETPLTGVGRENFAAAYMRHKPPESPEEVHNAHNLWVTLLAEFGLFGLLAVAVLILTWACTALRRHQTTRAPPTRVNDDIPNGRLIAMALAMCVVHALFARSGLSNLYILLRYWMLEIVLIWIVAFVCAVRVIHAHSEHDGWLAAGLIGAVMGALVHNLIGFSFFTTAGLGVAGVLAAAAVRLPWSNATSDEQGPVVSRDRLMTSVTTVVVWLALAAHLALIVLPTTRTQTAMTGLRRAASGQGAAERTLSLVNSAERIVSSDPWESSSLRELAQMLSRRIPPTQAPRHLLRAREIAARAARRSPATVATWGLLARINDQLGGALRAAGQMDEALASIREAVRCREATVSLYPTSARHRLALATSYFILWGESDDETARENSAAQFRRALELNDRLDKNEVMRLRDKELDSIRQRLERLNSRAPAAP